MKAISFIIPCYNSADYMGTCIDSILPFGDDIEILIVNDGSNKDNTLEVALQWQKRYPHIIRVIDQENRGHGGAVNHGLSEATGLYVKVVDSDDWLDASVGIALFDFLKSQKESEEPCDLVIANYVYDKTLEGTQQSMGYANVFPRDVVFGWDDIGHFRPSQYLLMHSAIYRTALLKNMQLTLPEHCFYVDNIFVYVPLVHVKTIRYFDVDLYHYFIGREGQSVNEQVMLSRIDQQLRITREMIDAVDVSQIESPALAQYMYNYLSMMMCICSVFLRMNDTEESQVKRDEIWDYLRTKQPAMYPKVRGSMLNFLTNLPSPAGRQLALKGYKIAQNIFKFN